MMIREIHLLNSELAKFVVDLTNAGYREIDVDRTGTYRWSITALDPARPEPRQGTLSAAKKVGRCPECQQELVLSQEDPFDEYLTCVNSKCRMMGKKPHPVEFGTLTQKDS